MQSAAKENSFSYMCELSERLFLSADKEACARDFCSFIGLELLNTHLYVSKCSSLQVSKSNLGLKWKQTVEKKKHV